MCNLDLDGVDEDIVAIPEQYIGGARSLPSTYNWLALRIRMSATSGLPTETRVAGASSEISRDLYNGTVRYFGPYVLTGSMRSWDCTLKLSNNASGSVHQIFIFH
jgi:hypothetical protein